MLSEAWDQHTTKLLSTVVTVTGHTLWYEREVKQLLLPRTRDDDPFRFKGKDGCMCDSWRLERTNYTYTHRISESFKTYFMLTPSLTPS